MFIKTTLFFWLYCSCNLVMAQDKTKFRKSIKPADSLVTVGQLSKAVHQKDKEKNKLSNSARQSPLVISDKTRWVDDYRATF
jgi:hypothetical protein